MTSIGLPDMNLAQMRSNADKAAILLKKLANRNRLLILCSLAEAEASVSELTEMVNLSQSALSQHLAILREHGLVRARRDAQNVYYSLTDSKALPIIQTLHSVYCR